MSTKRRSLQDTQNHAVSLDKTTMNQHKAATKVSTLSTAASTSKAAAKNTGGRGLARQQQGTDDANEYGLDDANISDDEEGGTRIGDIYIPPPVPPHCSTESKGPRLMIKKIENNNFKSYAGKVVLGPFHHCFTAIIGPNGSGKSNVIDSMLFVFGYRANKIRCKKISTLLHNSAKYPNMAMCSVAVHFRQIIDKEDGSCEEVPNSEIIVERTAYRDNSSFYTINGRRVQFKEVAKLLKQHSVDLDHNRFLILQGEVESIAMMKAKGQTENECGMLEYLEDIVGTTRYKAPLVKISDRVERLTEERTEKHNRCKLAEREMKDLEQPYNEALEYLRKENENTRTKNLRIQKYLSEKNKKLEEYTKEHTEVSNELKEHDEVEEALRKEREQKELQIKEEMANFDKLRKNKEDLEKKLEKASSNYSEVHETMIVTNNQRKQNKTQVEKHEAELADLRKVPENNSKEIAECEAKVEHLTSQKTEWEEELQRNYALLGEQTKPLIEKRDQLENELIDLKKSVDEAKAELTVSESQLKILKHDEITETRKYETLKTSYQDSESSLQEQHVNVKELKERLPSIHTEIETKTKQLGKLKAEEAQKRAKLIQLGTEISERTATMQNSRSNNKVLDFIMRQKNEGKIPGVLGRLGNLGAIDAKYDVAISTACGRLDNIVVDTVNTAQQCIEALKTFDVGRASFIALEKVKYLESHSSKIQTPQNAPRLYDLVRVEDERVLPAFYFSLRNTLVANDLEQGTRIAYGAKRYRVVTLNGDVIEMSGTMSGGGRTQIRGKMGTKVQTKTKLSVDSSFVTQKALENLQVQAEELQSAINYIQEEQGRLERDLHQLKQSLQKTEADIQKFCITIKSLEEQLPRIFKQLEAQKQRMLKTTTDAKKVQELETEIEKKKDHLKVCEEVAKKMEEKIAEVKQRIEAIHGDKVKTVQTKITNNSNQIKKLNANISKRKVEVSTSERNVIKLEKQIEQLQNDILKCQSDLTELNEQRQKYDNETVEITKKLEDAKAELENTRSGSSSIQKEILAIQKKESDSKLKRVEIDQKLQTVTAKLNDVKAQIPHWRDQLKPLRLHDIPGETEPQAPLKTYTEEELAAHTLQDIQYKESVQEEMLKKKPNLSCIRDYIEKRDVYLERVKVLEDITSKRNEMRQLYDDVRKKRYNEFMQGFHIITRKLKEMYQMITQGGDAELELVDSMDPFTEGVSFSVRPPKKTWKNISNLSGGEKTLSSLALVFALHYYKPSPLYFMDEIDAALDFKNISIVAHYIKERTKNAQFIIISLRSNMFELSDFIVGIYKVTDCTDSVTIKNAPFVLTPLQHNHAVPVTQQASTAKDTSMSFVQGPLLDSQLNPENEENSPPETTPIRDSTFAPPCESTMFSQAAIAVHNRCNAAAVGDGGITHETHHMNFSNATSPSSSANTNSITDAFFKKPLPPPAPQKATIN